MLLYGGDKLSSLDTAQEHHLSGRVHQGEAPELLVQSQDISQLSEGHPIPDVFNVLHHEVLHKEVVSSAGAGDNVRKVGQLLYQDDAIITAGTQTT